MKKLLLTTLILSMMTLTTHAEELTEEKIKRREAILKAEAERKAQEAKKAEQARQAEQAKKAEAQRKAEQARQQQERQIAEQKAFILMVLAISPKAWLALRKTANGVLLIKPVV